MGKYGPEKSPYLDVFRAVKTIKVFSFIIRLQMILSDVFIINLFTLSKFSTKISAFITAQKIKFSIKDFLGKCDQIRKKLQIWPHLRKQSLTENFIFSPDFGGLLSFQNSLRTSQKHFFFTKTKEICNSQRCRIGANSPWIFLMKVFFSYKYTTCLLLFVEKNTSILKVMTNKLSKHSLILFSKIQLRIKVIAL